MGYQWNVYNAQGSTTSLARGSGSSESECQSAAEMEIESSSTFNASTSYNIQIIKGTGLVKSYNYTKKGTSSGSPTGTVTSPGNNSPETTVTSSATVDPTASVPPSSGGGGGTNPTPIKSSQTWSLSNASVTCGSTIDMDSYISGGTVYGDTKTWSITSGTDKATINSSSGVLTPSKAGSVTVKYYASGTTSYKSHEDTCTVTINRKTESISISGNKSVTCGSTLQLTANNVQGRTITWNSSDTTIATVNSSGLVTPVKAGSCDITATASQTNTISSSGPVKHAITVSRKTEPIAITGNTAVTIGSTLQLGISNAQGRSITWNSSDKSIATVNSSGLVTPVKAGSCDITATASQTNTIDSYGPVTHRIQINNKKTQTVTIKNKSNNTNPSGSKITVGNKLILKSSGDTSVKSWNITEGTSYASITYSSNEATVTAKAKGKVKVNVIYNSTSEYNEGSTEITLYVYADQNPSVSISNNSVVYTSDSDSTKTKELTITVKDYQTTPSYTVKSGNITLTNNKIKASGSTTGTAVVTITCAEDTNNYWNKWTTDCTITIKQEKATTTPTPTPEPTPAPTPEPSTTSSTKAPQSFTLSTNSVTYGASNAKMTINGDHFGALTWSSTEPTVAEVSNNENNIGLINIKNVGTTYISLTAAGDDTHEGYTCPQVKLTITKQAGTSFTISGGTTVTVNNTLSLSENDNTGRTIEWTSNNESIATVNKSTGAVKGVSAGNVRITCTAKASTTMESSSAYIDIEVKAAVASTPAPEPTPSPSPAPTPEPSTTSSTSSEEPLKSTSINVSDVMIDLSAGKANKTFIKRIKYDESSKKVLFDIEPTISEGISTDGFGLRYSDSKDNLKNNSSTVASCKTSIYNKATSFTFEIHKSDINKYNTIYFYVEISASAITGSGYNHPDAKVIKVIINGVYTCMSKPQIKTVDLDVDTEKLKANNITYKKESGIHKFKVSKAGLSTLKNPTDTSLLPKLIYTVENGNGNATLTDIYSSNQNVAILENSIIKFKGNIGISYIDFKLNEFVPSSNDNYIRYLSSDRGPSLKIAVEDLALKEYLSERSNVFKFSADAELAGTAVDDCNFLFSLFDNNSDLSKITRDEVNIVFEDLKQQTSFKAEFKKISNAIIYIYNNNMLYGFLLRNVSKASRTVQAESWYVPYDSNITYKVEEYGDVNSNLLFNDKYITINCNISIYNYLDSGYLKDSGTYNTTKIILKNTTHLIPSKLNTYRLKIEDIIEEIGDIDLYNDVKNSINKSKELNYYIRLNSNSKKLKYYNFYTLNANKEYDILPDDYVKNIEDDVIIYSTYQLTNDKSERYSKLTKDYPNYVNSLIINIPTGYNDSTDANIELSLYFDLCITEKSSEYNNINNFKFNIKYTDNKKIIKRISINSPVIETIEYDADGSGTTAKALRFRLPKSYFSNIIDNYKDIYRLLSINYSYMQKHETNNVALYQYVNDYNIVKYNDVAKDTKIGQSISIKVDNSAVSRVEVDNDKDYILYVAQPHGKCVWSFNFIKASSHTNTVIPSNNTNSDYLVYIKESDMQKNGLNNKIKLAVKLDTNDTYKLNVICTVAETNIYESAIAQVRFETSVIGTTTTSTSSTTTLSIKFGYSINDRYQPSHFDYHTVNEAIEGAKYYINNYYGYGDYTIHIYSTQNFVKTVTYDHNDGSPSNNTTTQTMPTTPTTPTTSDISASVTAST